VRETLVALDDVSFDLDHGTTLGLVGPNGTGKSTVLKLAARILEPNAGRVMVDGRVAALLELGAGFHPDLTGRENLYLNGSLMGLSRREIGQRFQSIVDFAELERFVDMPVKHYSSGMYMRLAFSAAIHVDPDILLVDEVLAVGDQAFQNKCRERIAALRKAGLTIVLVSHDSTAIRELCDQALWLEDGVLRAQGAAETVVDAYYASIVTKEEARYAAENRTDTPPPAATAERWGSGEVEITDVEFLGPDGAPRHILLTGEPATVRMHYFAHMPVDQPVFGLAIHRADGIHITGPNTLDAGFEIQRVAGAGSVDYHIERLPLLAGTYELSTACYDHTCSHAYDHQQRRFPFHVRAGAVRERLGLITLAATWTHAAASGASVEDLTASTARETTVAL
jgi:ABC-type polysaccharide/polyol phosphate transport system ATPase subunit